ncbi:MAG: hypothetical protein WCO55_05140 [Candidatus Falkowbacteria bacterium]
MPDVFEDYLGYHKSRLYKGEISASEYSRIEKQHNDYQIQKKIDEEIARQQAITDRFTKKSTMGDPRWRMGSC